MLLWLNINPRSGVPIYLQLVEQIQNAVKIGILQPGEALPTVREMAKALTIAPNTIVKAYSELEAQGLIITRAGAGTIINSAVVNILKEQARVELHARLKQLVRDATALEVSHLELSDWFRAELDPMSKEPSKTLAVEKEQS